MIAFPAGVCFALSFIFGFASFQETSIVNATLIPALQPVLILLLATRMFGERRSGVELAYAALAFAVCSWWSPARAPTARRSRATCSRC